GAIDHEVARLELDQLFERRQRLRQILEHARQEQDVGRTGARSLGRAFAEAELLGREVRPAMAREGGLLYHPPFEAGNRAAQEGAARAVGAAERAAEIEHREAPAILQRRLE